MLPIPRKRILFSYAINDSYVNFWIFSLQTSLLHVQEVVSLFETNQNSNKVDILMTLLDERPRSILTTHEVVYPGLTDDQCYTNLKGVLRRFYQRSMPDAQVRESF